MNDKWIRAAIEERRSEYAENWRSHWVCDGSLLTYGDLAALLDIADKARAARDLAKECLAIKRDAYEVAEDWQERVGAAGFAWKDASDLVDEAVDAVFGPWSPK